MGDVVSKSLPPIETDVLNVLRWYNVLDLLAMKAECISKECNNDLIDTAIRNKCKNRQRTFTDRNELREVIIKYERIKHAEELYFYRGAGGELEHQQDAEELACTYGWFIGEWDMSDVTTFDYLFEELHYFNDDIGSWNTSSVTSMFGCFLEAHSFNGDISNWDTSSVTTMACMFASAYSFQRPLGSWDVSNVRDMNSMFAGCNTFVYNRLLRNDILQLSQIMDVCNIL